MNAIKRVSYWGGGPAYVVLYELDAMAAFARVLRAHDVWYDASDSRGGPVLDYARVNVPFWLAKVVGELGARYTPLLLHMLLVDHPPAAIDAVETLVFAGSPAVRQVREKDQESTHAIRVLVLEWLARTFGRREISGPRQAKVLHPEDWPHTVERIHRKRQLVRGIHPLDLRALGPAPLAVRP